MHRVLQIQKDKLQVFVQDQTTACNWCKCEFMHDDGEVCAYSASYRELKMHTLGHESITILVTDFTCLTCSHGNHLDGVYGRLFAAESQIVPEFMALSFRVSR